ncbi:Xylulose kinase [bioreactor metagenome]|uniref:Xylulose kinase n=1 Tax=bioreactor metagenome TaxID=1076179 RepID=A0A644YW69_9ZZZZ
MATTGSLTKWIRDEMAKDLLAGEAQGGENAYTSLFREAESIPVGSDGLICLPYFMGERMPIQDPLAKGVFFGLNLRHQRGHLVRAAMEGVGYGIAQNMDLLRSAGLSLDHVTAVGGGTRSRLWLQIVSDICGIAQRVPAITVGASYGDALMAGLAVGSIPNPDSIGSLIQIQDVIQPDWDRHKRYQKYLKIYSDLYQRNSDLMHQLW